MFGVLAVNKPTGWTSRDVVNRIHGILRSGLAETQCSFAEDQHGTVGATSAVQRKKPSIKVGHTGTLDPLASGVLLIAVGPATRLVEFSHQSRKAYVGGFRFGFTSDTLDSEGHVEPVELSRPVHRAELETELANWIGEIQQVPPKYSAVHIEGRRAYELARQGAEFAMPSRRITIHHLRLKDFCFPDWCLELECSTGTYVRSLGDDIAQALGTRAIMTQLERTRVGAVGLTDCLAMREELSFEELVKAMLPPSVLLETLPAITLPEDAARRLRNGIPLEVQVVMESADKREQQRIAQAQHVAAFDELGYLVGVLQLGSGRATSRGKGLYRSVRVFQRDVAQSAPTAIQPISMNRPQSPES